MRQSDMTDTKKIKGNKRHIAVDSNGILLEVIVDKGNEHDSQQLLNLVKKVTETKPNLLELIIGDSAYTGFDDEIRKQYNIGIHIQKSIKNLGKFSVTPIRWIVERSIAWMKGCRRLSVDYEKLASTSEAMVKLCFCRILMNKIHKFTLSG